MALTRDGGRFDGGPRRLAQDWQDDGSNRRAVKDAARTRRRRDGRAQVLRALVDNSLRA